MRWEILRDPEALTGLYAEWSTLWHASASRALVLHPAWIEAWWQTLRGEGELALVVCREGGLRGLAPLYVRPPRGGALRVRELALLGDGVVGARAAVLARGEDEAAVSEAVAEALAAERGWDLLELTLVGDEGGEALCARLEERGSRIERAAVQGRYEIGLPVALPETLLRQKPVACDAARMTMTVRLLAELSSRGAMRMSGEPAFVDFLERMAPRLAAEGLAEVWLVEHEGRPAAGHLLVTDAERRIELLRGTASGWHEVGQSLVGWSIAHAAEDGARSFELAMEPPPGQPIPVERVHGQRLRIYAATPTARLHARYVSIERRAGVVAEAARDELDRLRDATQEIVERAVARVATFSRLHLYRGELFVSSAASPPGVTLRLFSLADYEALLDRSSFLRRLDLEENYCRQKWERGDIVVLAELEAKPAGILWCARQPVFVPEIGREVLPSANECYIHDVYVTPPSRGRAVAPAMLEYLARELRGRDVYRAWALIERSNTSSTRAFEKASYASVADVIYARMGLASKLLVRPPDPEARAFLGLR